QGNLRLEYQMNMLRVGLNLTEEGRGGHDELLRQAITRAKPGMLPPHSDLDAIARNPTDFLVLLAPILVDQQAAGLVEIWQDPNRNAESPRGYLQFMVRMAGLASGFVSKSAARN